MNQDRKVSSDIIHEEQEDPEDCCLESLRRDRHQGHEHDTKPGLSCNKTNSLWLSNSIQEDNMKDDKMKIKKIMLNKMYLINNSKIRRQMQREGPGRGLRQRKGLRGSVMRDS